MNDNSPEVGDIAEYLSCSDDVGTLVGDVVKVGKSYADVTWRPNRLMEHAERTERIHLADPDGVTFKPAGGTA